MVSYNEGAIEFPEIAVWNVVFLSRDRESWWDLLTRRQYRHVVAYGYSAATDSWILVDPRLSHTGVLTLSHDQIDRWFGAHAAQITSVVRVTVQDGRRRSRWLGYWCSTSIKSLVGSRSSAFTPEGLRRDLLRDGAEIVS